MKVLVADALDWAAVEMLKTAGIDVFEMTGLKGKDLLHRLKLTEDFYGRCLKPGA